MRAFAFQSLNKFKTLTMAKTTTTDKEEKEDNSCFIIMPIADPDGYEKGHFKRVYQDIIKPACEQAGFSPIRADDVQQTNLIHLDILRKLIDSSMAICDLSSRNPNVLFELGIRQAFDKPTVLIQEVGTPKIFDISILRYVEYRKELLYREVLDDQKAIADNLRATKIAKVNKEGINSIISLLSLSNPASLVDVSSNDNSKMLQFILAEMSQLRKDFISNSQSKNFISKSGTQRRSEEIARLYLTHSSLVEDIKKMLNDGDSPQDIFEEIRRLREVHSSILALNLSDSLKDSMNSIKSAIEGDFEAYISRGN